MNLEKNLTFHTKNLKIHNWLEHKQILNLYDKSSISVVPSKWEEPFGRTAMDSAAYGCATITSSRGGLVETFNNKLVLKKLTSKEIYKMLNKLINNRSLLKKYQYENFNNVIHKIEDLVIYLDTIKNNLLDKNINILRNKGLKYFIYRILMKKIIKGYLTFL